MTVIKHMTESEIVDFVNSCGVNVVRQMIVNAIDDDQMDYEDGIITVDLNLTGSTANYQSFNINKLSRKLVFNIGLRDLMIYELLTEFSYFHLYHGLDGGMAFVDFGFHIKVENVCEVIRNKSSKNELRQLLKNNELNYYIKECNKETRLYLKEMILTTFNNASMYLDALHETWLPEDSVLLLDTTDIEIGNIHTLFNMINTIGHDTFKQLFYRWGVCNAKRDNDLILINNAVYEYLIEHCKREMNKLKLLYGDKLNIVARDFKWQPATELT